MIETLLLVVLVCVALALIGLVLIQQGKGADAGASFGSGASQTVFGGAGSGNFLTKSSWSLGIVFFACCLALGYIARQQAENSGRIDFSETPVEQVAPQSASDVPELPAADASVPAASGAEVPAAQESAPSATPAAETPQAPAPN